MTEMWEHFKQCYIQLVEKRVPFKQIKQESRLKPPWVSSKSVLTDEPELPHLLPTLDTNVNCTL